MTRHDFLTFKQLRPLSRGSPTTQPTPEAMNIRSERITRAVLCSILSAGLAATALAQTAPTRTEERIALEKFVVTGSLIPVAAGAPAIPVRTLTVADLERTGITTDLADILRRGSPQFYGGNNIG